MLDVLRTLQRELQCQQGKEALFMAGSFAYDLIASFEDLPRCQRGATTALTTASMWPKP